MTFQIVRIDPMYCQITDGLVGHKAHPLPMAYHTLAYAHKLAGKLHAEEYEGCGDSSFTVVRYGESAFSKPIHPVWPTVAAVDGEIPF